VPEESTQLRIGPPVAVLCPVGLGPDVLARIAEAGLHPIPLAGLSGSSDQDRLLVEVAALACDAALLVLPAAVGLDTGSTQVWLRLAELRLPRAVLVTGLGSDTVDIEECAAIVTRVLEDEVIVPALPVLDDDERPVASMDLLTLEISTPDSTYPGDPDHLAAAATARSNATEAILVVTNDDELLDHGLVGLVPAPERLAASLQRSVREGDLVPVIPDTPDRAPAATLARWWSRLAFDPARLLPIGISHDDAHVQREGRSLEAVILKVDGPTATARALFGRPRTGPAFLTMPGTDASGPHPDRAWPTWIELPEDADPPPDGTFVVTLPLRSRPGETLCAGDEPAWLVP
jgi:hypothetical protein